MREIVKLYTGCRLLTPSKKEVNQQPVIVVYTVEVFKKGVGTADNSETVITKAAKYCKELQGWKRLKGIDQIRLERIEEYKNLLNAKVILFSNGLINK